MADAQKLKAQRAQRRKFRVRKAIKGTAQKPRLSIYRSNLHIYAQLIDDEKAVTLAAVSSNDKGDKLDYGGNVSAAAAVGRRIAEKAKTLGVTAAAFDRGEYRFHGRVKALARAATEGGLVCTGLTDEPKKQKKDAAPAAEKKADKGDKAAKPKGGDKKPAKAK